jgi:hypothetical protein
LSLFTAHQGLVLHCIPQKVGVNQNGINEKSYCHQKQGVSLTEYSQPQATELKIRENKL